MSLYPPFWRPFSNNMAGFFLKVIPVIFENMRQIIATLVSTYIIFREYYSDSILRRASHNGGLNLAGYCGNSKDTYSSFSDEVISPNAFTANTTTLLATVRVVI